MFTLQFDQNKGYLFAKFSKSIDLNEQLDYVKSITELEMLPKRLKILQDFTEATFTYELSDMSTIVANINKFLVNYENVRIASIHNKVEETISSLMLSDSVESQAFQYDIFASFEEAELWLGL